MEKLTLGSIAELIVGIVAAYVLICMVFSCN